MLKCEHRAGNGVVVSWILSLLVHKFTSLDNSSDGPQAELDLIMTAKEEDQNAKSDTTHGHRSPIT